MKLFFGRLAILVLLFQSTLLPAQLVDTLAFQDFEVTPATPTWTFTGPVVYNSGTSSASAAPPNSPIGIGGSRAWETTTNSGGLILQFANISIPAVYDSVRIHFNLAAMCLTSSTGGPDDLDYVLVEVSTNGGVSFYSRMRIRGAVNNNSFWPYSATGFAKLYYQPTTEVVFQPINTGLATTLGYSNCEIVFPGTVTDVAVRITGRSSSSTDTWLIDNVVLTGDRSCTNTTSSITASACDSYLAPSGAIFTTTGIHTDIISNMAGCDSIITINLTIDTLNNGITASNDTATATQSGANYQWIDCSNNQPIAGATNQTFVATVSGNYAVILNNGTCRDTSACVTLTVTIPPTGIEQYSTTYFTLAPNPSNGKTVLFFGEEVKEASIQIRDISGRIHWNQTQITGNQIWLDLSDLPAGMYFLEATWDGKHKLERLVRSH